MTRNWQNPPQGWQPSQAQQPTNWQRPGGWTQQGAWARHGGWPPQGTQTQHGPWTQHSAHGWGPTEPLGPAKQPRLSLPLKALLAIAAVAAAAFVAVLFMTGTSYENDDYQPPEASAAPDELVLPKSKQDAERLLTKNPIYTKTAPSNVNCQMTAFDGNNATQKALQNHFDQFTACLMRVWDRTITDPAEGITMFRPRVTVYQGSLQTGCGQVDQVNAFYCGADQELYYHARLQESMPASKVKGGIDAVMAHEFGHFIQGRSGILAARVYLGNGASKSATLESTRRSEAQADCLSAMWTRANVQAMGLTEQDLNSILGLFRSIGDDKLSGNPHIEGDHGLSRTRESWARKGMNSSNVGVCDSWSVPADQVR